MVGFLPKYFLIALVRNDVIDAGCNYWFFMAFEWIGAIFVRLKIACAILFPFRVVSAFPGRRSEVLLNSFSGFSANLTETRDC